MPKLTNTYSLQLIHLIYQNLSTFKVLKDQKQTYKIIYKLK